MAAQLAPEMMELIADMMDAELVPQVYLLEAPVKPWRPLLRDDPYEPPEPLVPADDPAWDIL
jgi:hypothetical protein